MKILVTGGAGYIGSHTVKELIKSRYEVAVLDNLSTGHKWAVNGSEFYCGDLLDREYVKNVFNQTSFDAVIHFAGSAYVGESMLNPGKYFRNNVQTTINLLDAMVDTNVKYIVFSSSCTVYGMPISLPISEGHPKQPISPYGASKSMIEDIIYWYCHAYSIKNVCLRYFNAAGADPDGELGELHNPETHLIPLAISASIDDDKCFQIMGTDYPTKDGTTIRDFVHVYDLAKAHLLALEYLASGNESDVFNLGLGVGYSVMDILEEVKKVGGREVPFVQTERRPGDPPVLVADSVKAKKSLNWQPEMSDLSSIVQTAWNWQKRLAK